MSFTKLFLLHAAGSAYENMIGQSFTQRLIRRKVSNLFRRLKGEPSKPSYQDCRRLNREAARSV
jgi:hypothetical protein